jgi:hypothetical protein
VYIVRGTVHMFHRTDRRALRCAPMSRAHINIGSYLRMRRDRRPAAARPARAAPRPGGAVLRPVAQTVSIRDYFITLFYSVHV